MKHVLFNKFNSLKYRILIVGLLSIITVLPTSAANTAKSIEDVKIRLDFLEGNLKDLLSNIESKTDYRFFYTDQAVEDTEVLTLDRSKGTVADILKDLARLKNLHFKQVNNNISVKYLGEKPNQKKVEIVLERADINIKGQVTDKSGEAIPGAAISVIGTTVGTITDIDGNFSLTAPEDGELMVSYIGFTTQRIQINSRSIINVTLEENIAGLEEVVVTALGIKREAKSLGYATSTVESEEMTINRTPNFINSLQGKVAGVNISSMGSGPQGSSKIRIRGVSSFGGNNSPLIIVNGVPIDNTNFGVSGDVSEVGSNRRSDSGDGLSSINPDDITSMSVLKGAAASALYGARAKDGVIMITTRNRATGSGIQIELNTNYTNDTPLDFTDYQYEYGQGEGGLRPTSPRPVSGVWSFGEKIEPGMTQILFDGIEVPYTAQPNKIRDYYRNGSTLSNTVTLSSGGENGGFSLSVANMDSKAILPGSNYNRKTINLGFTQNIKKLKVSGNINYSKEDRINPPNIAEQDFSPVVIYTLSSTMPLDLLEQYAFDENGDEFPYSRFTNRTNPYFALSRFENNIRDRVYGNITARYDITDWLYVQGRFGQDFYSRDSEYNLPTGSQRQSSPPPGFVNGQYIQDIRRFREVNTDFLLGMNKSFGDFGLMVNLGGNQMYRKLDVNTLLGENFYTRDLYTIGNASKITTNYSISERQVNSLYGSTELSWKGFLYLNGTVRNDWFSTLSPANRSIVYPSITGSFVFSQAFENLPNWMTFGKIRVAYAEVGSDTDVQPYANNLFYNINQQQFPNSNGVAQPVGSVSGSVVPNSNLRPMRVREKEIGLEMTLFDNLRFEVSYYDKLSSDQILQAQISNASGYVNQLINVGESENKGVEMYANISPIKTSDFEWNFGANASYNQSKVLSLGDDVDGTFITVGTAEFHGELRQEVGKPMAQLYGWGYLRDEQGRQVFDPNSGRPLRSNEQINFGSAIPVWVGGFTNSFNYKKLSFSFLIDFKLGHKLISGTHTNAYRHGLDKATLIGREQGFVVGDGVNPNGEINTAQAPVQTYYETIRSGRMSEQSVFNAGSWQLRQLTLGYDLTDLIPENNFIKGLRLNVVSNNVAVIKKWVPHIHPDQNGIISDNRAGLEATGLPVTRSMGFNLNVKF
ncbi:SusC/RagA family TonB-linked outer membrane protein [uncultured Cyclobacterium sp.]|uniref:SusC/RagA family TonB-linked outer membrane protein n=1 Tax=uncultured Cyclobacterium sp. TaxID=453820 RepID=UPI0030EB73CC